MGNRRQPFRFSMSGSQYGASMQPIQKAIEISRPAAPAWMRYGIALLAFGVALVARFLLTPFLPPTGFPFLTFFPAVILATLFGRIGPGLLTSALSIAAARYFFIPPPNSFTLTGLADIFALVFFGLVLLVDCIVIHVMTTSLARVRAERARNAAL